MYTWLSQKIYWWLNCVVFIIVLQHLFCWNKYIFAFKTSLTLLRKSKTPPPEKRFSAILITLNGDVIIYELKIFLCELRVTFCELKIKITSCQCSLRVASYYSRVMSYFLRVENKNYELQVMALFHLKKKFTKHSEDRKSLLPV